MLRSSQHSLSRLVSPCTCRKRDCGRLGGGIWPERSVLFDDRSEASLHMQLEAFSRGMTDYKAGKAEEHRTQADSGVSGNSECTAVPATKYSGKVCTRPVLCCVYLMCIRIHKYIR